MYFFQFKKKNFFFFNFFQISFFFQTKFFFHNIFFFKKPFPDISHISQKILVCKQISFINKISTSVELNEILKDNQIKRYSHYTKSKLIYLLAKRGLIPEKYDANKQVKAMKAIDPKYIFLRQICNNPKKLEIHDLETDKDVLYPYIYKAALTLDTKTEVISIYNGKV